MEKMKVLSLFAGIGGFDLGLERAGGFETVAFCEIDPFCQKVLAKHWPNVPCFRDVRELRGEQVGAVDLICGGFPCQDISTAGNQAGMGEGTRSGLWSEIVRLTSELRPSFLLVENVAALLSGPSEQRGGWFGRVLGDLAAIGYDAEWRVFSAKEFGAPHLRERVFLLAYPAQERCAKTRQFRHNERSQRLSRQCETPVFADIGKERIQGVIEKSLSRLSYFSWCKDVGRVEDLRKRSDIPEPFFRGSRDGVSDWVDRVGSCGNAIVPAIAEFIGLSIMDAMGWQENTKA